MEVFEKISTSNKYLENQLNISLLLQSTVMNDIVATLFSKSFMDELLKPQKLYSHRTMKTVLTRIAHTSIMRLNPASMDRVRRRRYNRIRSEITSHWGIAGRNVEAYLFRCPSSSFMSWWSWPSNIKSSSAHDRKTCCSSRTTTWTPSGSLWKTLQRLWTM